MDGPIGLLIVRMPPGTMVDGSVVELAQDPDGVVTAQVRIPGPPVP